MTNSVKRYFNRHPQLELLAEVLLERSNPAACEFLIQLAPLVERPAIFAALKKFALGQRGSDDLRMQALTTLSQAGYVEGQIEVWRGGSLRPIGLVSQEIFCEPIVELPPEVNELALAGHEAIHDGRGTEAEQLFDRALRLRPEDTSLQFNRAVAIGLQGRADEALEIVRRIHRERPEYVFARTHLAEECIANGNLEKAKTLLVPIVERWRLHKSEYAAWCSANINLALAESHRDVARSLLKAWEQIDPEDHRIKIWKGRIRGLRGLLRRALAPALSGLAKQ